MSMHLQKINFALHGETALAEIKGDKAFVYIAHKKITLSIDQKERSLSAVEKYLNRNKNKIVQLVQQHNIIERAFNSEKKIILLDEGRFHYSRKNSTVKNTTMEQEYELLQQKINDHEHSPKRKKWEKKLALIGQAIEEMKAFQHLKPAAKESALQQFEEGEERALSSSRKEIPNEFHYSYKPLEIKGIDFVSESPIKTIPAKHIRAVRKRTHKRMKNRVSTYGIKKTLKKVKLYRSPPSLETERSKAQLMNTFEVLQVPISMDFDKDWGHLYYGKKSHSRWVQSVAPKVKKVKTADWLSGNREKVAPTHKLMAKKPSEKHQLPERTFFCHYTPTLNIVGRAGHRDDYSYYFSREGRFEEDRYLQDMELIFYHALLAQKASGAQHIVWNAFGMEADLRHLSKRDARYSDDVKMAELKYKIASRFREQYEREEFGNLQLHLCLSTGKGTNLKETMRKEAIENHNAFVSAFSTASSKVKKRVTIHQNADMAVLAQDLAEKQGSRKVSMIYAANTDSIGDNWSKKPTQDNVHCRSTAAASVAYFLDDGLKPKKTHEVGELSKRIRKYGGEIIEFRHLA